MLNKISILFCIFSLFLYANELAIVTKSKGNVTYKKNTLKDFEKTVKAGKELYDEDLLKTGIDGFVMFMYLDDGTLIKVHKNSEVYISGKISDRSINKRVNAGEGFFRFDVKEQKGDEFTVVTPSSVASVKGTDFIIDIGPEGDVFYGFEGIVEVSNKISNTKLRLQKDNKIESLKNGDISVNIMTPTDYNNINNIELEIETNDQQDVTPEIDNQDSGESNQNIKEMRIKVLNDDGVEKEIIIRYTN
mgnify:CR=1 FL=1|tara:strand:+ start:2322 stop:3062 length:741 start_codon:yes stop_codon:yes gene_type:complete